MSRQTEVPNRNEPVVQEEEPNVLVTPATREEPLPAPELTGEERLIEFKGQEYVFPAGTSDDDMFEFLGNIPAEEVKEEPKQVFRERAMLKKNEGTKKNKEGKHIAYRDSIRNKEFPKGIPTAGRGHVLTKAEQKLYPEGTAVPDAVVKAWFDEDLQETDDILVALLEKHKVFVPDEVYDVLFNMTFNMGKGGISGFTLMWKAIVKGDWKEAANQMLTGAGGKGKSQYLKDVGVRATNLAARMAAVGAPKEVPTEPTTPAVE